MIPPIKLSAFKGEPSTLRDVARFPDGTIVKTTGDQPTMREQINESPINAALMVHSMSHIKEAEAMLNEARALIYRESLTRANGELGEPYLKDLLKRIDKFLTKLNTVQIP